MGENAIRWKAAADVWETLRLTGCKCREAVQNVGLVLDCLDLKGPYIC